MMMLNRKAFILPLILCTMITSIPGCTISEKDGVEPQPTVPSTPPPAISSPPSEKDEAPSQPVTPPSAPSLPIEVKLTLSHAPKLGETAEAILTIIANLPSGRNLGNIQAWLEFSQIKTSGSYRESQEILEIASKDVLTAGELNWEGVLTSDAPLEFRADIKFPEEGIWEVTGYMEGDGGWIRSNRVKVAVQYDRAGIFSSSTPEWMKDYSPSMGVALDAPIAAILDLSKPPKLGEYAKLTWSVVSDRDLENVRVWMEFNLMEPGVLRAIKMPNESIFINGALPWEGSLKKGVPVSSTETVAFPDEGDWQVILISIAPAPPTSYSGSDEIYLNVTEERGRWGWAEPHEQDWSSVPPPPPAPAPK